MTAEYMPLFKEPRQTSRLAWACGAIAVFGLLVMIALDLPSLSTSTVLAKTVLYTCPRPQSPRPPSLFNPSRRSEPIHLASTSNFSAVIVHDVGVCNAFEVVIARRDKQLCAEMEQEVPSPDSKVSQWVKEKLGPDTLVVQVDGAERMMSYVPDEYLGNCEYLYRFRLNSGGRIWITATLLHERYETLDERTQYAPISDPRFPPYGAPVLAATAELDLCGSRCPVHFAPSVWPTIRYPSTSVAAQDARDRSELPSCGSFTRSGKFDGGYLQGNAYDRLYPPSRSPHSEHGRVTSGNTPFVPFGCRWTHSGTRYADHSPCVAKQRKVYFTGDSHSRGMSDLLLHRFQGNRDVLPKSSKEFVKSGSVGNLTVDYVHDVFGQKPLTCEHLDNYDAIVMSIGTHAIARSCEPATKWETDLARILKQFSDTIDQCATRPTAAAKKRAPVQLVFLNIPVFETRSRGDCRTGARITYWNKIASELMSQQRHKWEIIDVERYSKPVAVDLGYADGTHYLTLDASDAIADDLIDRLQICEPDVDEDLFGSLEGDSTKGAGAVSTAASSVP